MKKLEKEDSLIVKGIAIVFMLMHHLFRFPERFEGVSYISILPFKISGNTIEYYIGDFGKICVALFFFISGYGIYLSFEKDKNVNIFKKIVRRLIKLFINYWVVFMIFIPIGLIFFRDYISVKLDFILILSNLIGISSELNGEWWFLSYYIQLLIFYPFLKKAIEKNWKVTILISIILSLTYNLHQTRLFVWQLSFVVGIYFAKFEYFDMLDKFYKKTKNRNYSLIITLILLFIIRIINVKYIFFLPSYGVDFLLSPFIIYSYVILSKKIKINKILFFLGYHSINIWLVHSFFCYHYFQKITYFPKLSILILIWNLILSIISSYGVFFIIKKITDINKKPKQFA